MIKSEIKVVTYIDLVTQVAGVPSFLLIICKFWLKKFENYYSQFQMSKSVQLSQHPDKDDKNELPFCRQLGIFLRYENPVVYGFTWMLKKGKCIKPKKKRKPMTLIEKKSAVLKEKLDLKKILLQLYNFDVNMVKVCDKLKIVPSAEKNFKVPPNKFD